MSLTDPCPRCDEKRAWLLRPVRQMGGALPVERRSSGQPANLGWYEGAVCMGCGWCQLWAREYEPSVTAEPMQPCVICTGQRGWVIHEAPDVGEPDSSTRIRVHLAPGKFKASLLFSHGGWLGKLGVRICVDCAAANWFCQAETGYPEDLDEPLQSPRACRRCQGVQTLAPVEAPPYREEEERRERAIVAGPSASIFSLRDKQLGKLALDVCRACFAVEWYGTKLEQLLEYPSLGLFPLPRGPSANDAGPYR